MCTCIVEAERILNLFNECNDLVMLSQAEQRGFSNLLSKSQKVLETYTTNHFSHTQIDMALLEVLLIPKSVHCLYPAYVGIVFMRLHFRI
jgi:hypothetical protein